MKTIYFTAAAQPPKATNESEGVLLNILIADDHAIFRKGLRTILVEMNLPCVVEEAADGIQALSLGLKHAWDLVLLDITMPGLSGIKVLERLKQARPGVSIVMLSLHASPGYVRHCLQIGAAGYISKDSAAVELEAVAENRFQIEGAVVVEFDLAKNQMTVKLRQGERVFTKEK